MVETGDIYSFGSRRMFRVTGVYLGAEGQESVVGLRALDRSEPTAHGETIGEMFVPLDFIEPQLIYRQVQRAA